MIGLNSYAQSYQGINTSRKAGILSTQINPANLSFVDQKVDIHLIGINLNLATDAAPLSTSDLSDFVDDPKGLIFSKLNKESFTGQMALDLMGPSFAFAVNKKLTVGLSTRARVSIGLTDMDVNLAKTLDGYAEGFDFTSNPSINIESNRANTISAFNWTDIGLSASYRFMDMPKHKMSFGLTGKAIFSNIYASASLRNLDINVDTANNNVRVQSGTGTVSALYGSNLNTNDLFSSFLGAPKGFGFDMGMSYAYYGRGGNLPVFRVGVSLLDIGSVTYDKADARRYNYALNASNLEISKYLNGSVQESLDSLKAGGQITLLDSSTDVTVKLPMAFNLNFDYNMAKNFGFTFIMQKSLVNADDINTIRAQDYYSVIPRFFLNFFELYTPVTYNTTFGTTIGAGMRLGPLYLGSNTVLSSLMTSSSRMIDFHLGLKFGFGNRSKNTEAASK